MSHWQSQGFTNSNNSSLVVVATYAATIALFIIAFSLTFLGNTSSSAKKSCRSKIDQGKDSIFSFSVAVKILKTETSNI